MITLVLGGARSGKSKVAESLAARTRDAVTYLATTVADPFDHDLVARIAAHVDRRPSAWTTVEVAGPALTGILATTAGTVLVDGLGAWVASGDDLVVDAPGLCAALAQRSGDSVVVSDEVGLGVHPATEVGRRFRDTLGLVNQAVAAVADEVLLVVAGRVLPLGRAID